MGTDSRRKKPANKLKWKNTYCSESKFSIISCPVTESYCHIVINEINDLYAESELARINKEYFRSVTLLEEAYNKANELNQKSCLVCADLFKYHINKTFDAMREELHEISRGFFSSKNYRMVYSRLCEWENK